MIIELILPNSSLKKYINLVVGLVLILIFLQPIFQLFQVDIEDILDKATPALDTTLEEERMKNSIELKKNEIQAQQDAYILEEMAVQMKNEVKEGLRENYGISISNITYEFYEEMDISLDSLKTVQVTLREKAETQNVSAVEEVVIDVQKDEITDETTSDMDDDIKSYLREKWQLEDQTISLLWEGGI
ncbi:stage III sporulation protein AF [Aquibacillus albus]|uniref:Stage III sporulation protein AF n=2 Tax=Aquibacillus albus TaxID=1168171 RepID=A0ABS2MVH9_9BACI|nr:stage III sporulation protein AF [Aquibacillus albus]